MVGDRVSGAEVIGFAFVPPPSGEFATADNDRLLVTGDEKRLTPPDRPVPAPGTRDGIVRSGQLPPEAVLDHIGHGTEVASHLQAGLAACVERAEKPHGGFLSSLLAEMATEGHIIWHVGGGVRDLIADGPQAEVRDLDFTGTAPVGSFSATVRSVLALADAADLRQKVSDNLVSSLKPRGQRARVLEYKPLSLPGLPFRASGGDMVADAEGRDLTVNSLYYDAELDLLVDPTGQALSDLRTDPRPLVTLHPGTGDASECAVIIFRAVKFLARWQANGVEVEPEKIAGWAGQLDPSLPAGLSAAELAVVLRHRDRILAGIPHADIRAAAAQIGAGAERLIEAKADQ